MCTWRARTGLSGSPSSVPPLPPPPEPLSPKERILPEGIGDLHRAPAVGRVVDVDRGRAADDVAVISPHHHLRAVDVPRNNAGERVEVPAGEFRVLGCMRDVIRAVLGLHRDLLVRLQVVGAEVQLRARGEENVSILQNVAERDARGVGKRGAVRPGVPVVFRQKDLPVRVSERLVAALRVNVLPGRLRAIPEVVRLTGDGLGGSRVGAHPTAPGSKHRAGGCRRGAQESAASHSSLWHHHVSPFVLKYSSWGTSKTTDASVAGIPCRFDRFRRAAVDSAAFGNPIGVRTRVRAPDREVQRRLVLDAGDLVIHVIEIPKFNKTLAELETALDFWLYFLKNGEELDADALPAELDRQSGVRKAMGVLKMFAQNEMERELYEGRLKAKRDLQMVDAARLTYLQPRRIAQHRRIALSGNQRVNPGRNGPATSVCRP